MGLDTRKSWLCALTVALFLTACGASSPEVLASYWPSEIYVNDTVILACSAYNDTSYTDFVAQPIYQWTINGVTFNATSHFQINATFSAPGTVNFSCQGTDNTTGLYSVTYGSFIVMDAASTDDNLENEATLIAYPEEASLNETVTLECLALLGTNYTEADIVNVTWTQGNYTSQWVTGESKTNVTSGKEGIETFTCTIVTNDGYVATGNGTVYFYNEDEITAFMYIYNSTAPVYTNVTIECRAYEVVNWTEVSIKNIEWTEDGHYIATTPENRINVLSDTPDNITFVCAVEDTSGRRASAYGFIQFFEIEDDLENEATLIAYPEEASLNETVTLECLALLGTNYTEADIVNVTWTQGNYTSPWVTGESKTNVTSGKEGIETFTCTIVTNDGYVATGNGTVYFYNEDEITAFMYIYNSTAPVYTNVTIECRAYEVVNWTEVSIKNIEWTEDGHYIATTPENRINVLSDTPDNITFVCAVEDTSGRRASAYGFIQFFENEDDLENETTLIAYPEKASLNETVTLECLALLGTNYTEADIVNVTWIQGNYTSQWVTGESKTNVTSGKEGTETFTCTIVTNDGYVATGNGTVYFYKEDEITAFMSVNTSTAPVDTNVTIECRVYELVNWTEVAIKNIEWYEDGHYIATTVENKINVSSDTPDNITFVCEVEDIFERRASAYGSIEFLDIEENIANETTSDSEIENENKTEGFPDVEPEIVAYMSADPWKALVNSTITLECTASETIDNTGVTIANVSWTQGNTLLGVTQDNKINVTSDTAGYVAFDCLVVDIYGRNDTDSYIVMFYENNTEVVEIDVEMSADPTQAPVNSTVTLECTAYETINNTEVPIANVSWTQGKTSLGVTQDNKINVTSDTAGAVNFTCTIVDVYGRSDTANETVTFYEKPTEEVQVGYIAVLTATPTEATVDSNVTLVCNAYQFGNNTEAPISNVSWTQAGKFLKLTQSNTITVTWYKVGEVVYTCTVTDDTGRSATANTTIDFYEEVVPEVQVGYIAVLTATPTEATVDSNVTLVCNAYQFGNNTEAPISNVSWTQAGKFLKLTQSNTITVTWYKVGEVVYTCTVTDDTGRSATANTTIDFYEEVVPEEPDFTVQINANATQAEANSNILLKCQAYETDNTSLAVDIANVTWMTGDDFLEVTQDNVIHVTSDSVGEVTFTCVVADYSGRDANASITVDFLPVYVMVEAHVSTNTTTMGADVDTTVEVQCWPNNGQSPYSISWRKDGVDQSGQTGNNYLYVTMSTAGSVTVECTVSDDRNMNATNSATIRFNAPMNCSTGQGYSWVQAGCANCDGTNEYNDGGFEVCVYCSYTTNRADACYSSDPAKTTTIGRRDIYITSTIWSTTCDSSTVTLAQVSTQLSSDARVFFRSAFPSSSGLCANEACENVVVSVARKSLMCQACNGTSECSGYKFKTTVKACLYDVDEFVNTGVNSVHRRAQEVFLESMKDISQFPSSSNSSVMFVSNLMLAFPPTRVDTTTIAESENRELLATFRSTLSWSSNYQTTTSTEYQNLNTVIQEQLPPMFGTSSDLMFVTFSAINQYTLNQANYVEFTLSFVFRRAIDTSLLEAVAEIGIRAHSLTGGSFGTSSFSFQSEIHVFRSQTDMQSGTSAIVWCTYLEKLSQTLSLTYCSADSECSDTSLWFECLQDDTNKVQRALYPYGTSAGDSVLEMSFSNEWYWYYNYISDTINFASGAPFGIRKMKSAHILPNGVITFDTPVRTWWPYLEYAQRWREQNILAVLWHSPNYYNQSGKVYYQLYEKPGVNSVSDTAATTDTWSAVLDRAKTEVMETLGVTGFEPNAALVATWYRAEPSNWWNWICKYYEYYSGYSWWEQYYKYYYDLYCLNAQTETNTFQCVYVTDGQTAYAITTYMTGEMNWSYDRYRPIDVGYTNPYETRDFGFRYTDLTTKLTTNTFNTGRYGTWIEKVGEYQNTDAQCVAWFVDNLYMLWNATHWALLNQLYNCPCNMERLGFQWTFYSWAEASWRGSRTYKYCYYLGRKSRDSRIRDNPFNKLCCYYYTYPSDWSWSAFRAARRDSIYVSYPDPYAGHILKHDPYRSWWWRSGANARLSKLEDFDPKNWCTRDSSVPSSFGYLFNLVRPDLGCTNEVTWFRGRAMGDPHIATLDSHSYTFNGKGEYRLLEISSLDFALQGRTDQATNTQGNLTSATVFVAFAAQESNTTKCQIELSNDKSEMVITANNNDISLAFYAASNYTFEGNDLTVERQDRNSTPVVVVGFPSNIALEVYVGINNLEFTVIVPTSLKGETTGLMGNFNDDSTDEYKLPDGTQLTTDQTNTERKIFENFGREWEVTTSTTIFKYPTGETALNYQFPSFEPLFREEANQTLLAEAEQTCGAQEDACIFDLLATGDPTFAETTKNSAQEDADVKQSLSNNLPVLSVSLTTYLSNQSFWHVTHGQESKLQFSATDADNDVVSFELVESVSGVTLGNSSGVLAYTPDYSSSVLIGVRASDGKGKSSALYVNILVCTGCSGNGSCDFTQSRETQFENGRFLISACSCLPAYDGDDCDQDANGCADEPCGQELNCTDIAASVQGNQTVGYLCEDCPDGYTLEGSSCVDANECIANGTSPVCPQNSECSNTIGSFLCSCSSGYRTDPDDAASCKDIDECAERIHDCEQVCDNAPGSFNCSCYGSGVLNQDGKTCTSTASCNVTCEHFCQQNENNSTQCNCRSGYELANDGKSCNDIDECSGTKTPCSQGCSNTQGSFTCSCYSGFTLAADNTSCTECETSYWGVNCVNQCECNGNGNCGAVRGCVCNAGWSGTRCVTDVDECATDGACASGQVCTNSIGSYTCTCPTGYSLNGKTCADIDECDDVLLHTCDLTTQDCSNNLGSYSCVCRTGYARNTNNECVDIDECTTQSHGCEQICENTDGSYNCDCYLGYSLDSDRQNCIQRSDPCSGSSLNCSQICTVDQTTNTAQCLCQSGYGLVGTETCEDINECDYDNLNLCSYKLGCSNTVGGFTCSCQTGLKVDNDGRSCIACGTGSWGANCAYTCGCDPEGSSSCNAETGCVCKTGFTDKTCGTDIDECASGALTCAEGEVCVNTRGSAECQCIQGYTRVLGTCTDLDECAVLSNNDCDQLCTNFAGGYKCNCNAGYTRSGNACIDVDECALNADSCQLGCENSEGSYRCTCSDGLKLAVDGVSCIVADACEIRVDCTDTCAIINGTETCICPRGKQLDNDGFTCSDVDMCIGSPCEGNCNETVDGTSYTCSCNDGQQLDSNGFNCTDCVEGTYGSECSQTCSCNDIGSASCDKVNGTCTCNSGWTGADCSSDVDECSDNSHNCTSKLYSTCDNTPGSFVCKCDDGYYTSSSNCVACQSFTFGDECSSTCDCSRDYSSGCDAVSGTCICLDGWTGTRCDTDKDECAVDNNCTQANRTNYGCQNTPGSFECQCDEGYEDINDDCVDIDECAADYTNVCNQNCSNTVGNYTCSCNTGYSLASDGRTCEDIDECATGQHSCEDVCTNAVASYTCSCNSGRELDTDNLNCYNALSSACTATLDLVDVSTRNLRETQGDDYKFVEGLVQPMLESHFTGIHSGFRKLLVTGLRHGSVITDFTTVINTEATENPESTLADALVALAANGLYINGTFTTVNVVLGTNTITSSTDKCEIMALLNACTDDQTCQISESGSAYCSSSSDDDDIPLIVGLSVGLPLGILLIVAIAFACWYKTKYKGQKRVNSRMDHYNDEAGPSSHRSSPDPFTAFKSNQKNSLIEVD